MQLVIDIDKQYYDIIMGIPQIQRRNLKSDRWTRLKMLREIAKDEAIYAIKKGTPLPEHGKIADIDKVIREVKEARNDYCEFGWAFDDVIELLDKVEPIISATKEGEQID